MFNKKSSGVSNSSPWILYLIKINRKKFYSAILGESGRWESLYNSFFFKKCHYLFWCLALSKRDNDFLLVFYRNFIYFIDDSLQDIIDKVVTVEFHIYIWSMPMKNIAKSPNYCQHHLFWADYLLIAIFFSLVGGSSSFNSHILSKSADR